MIDDDFLTLWKNDDGAGVFRTILALVERWHDAEEVEQRLWIKVHRYLRAGKPMPRSPKAWLKKTATNTAIDFLRKRGAEERDRKRLLESGMVRSAVNPAVECEREEIEQLIMQLMAAVKSLPEPQRQLVDSRSLKGYTLDAIAAELCITPPGVQKRLLKIYQRLQLELRDRVEELLPEWTHAPAR